MGNVPIEAYSGVIFVIVYIAIIVTAVLWNE